MHVTASFASSSIINGSCDLLLASHRRTVLSYEALAYISSPAPPPTPPPHESLTSPLPPRHVTYSFRVAWPQHFLIAWAVIRSVRGQQGPVRCRKQHRRGPVRHDGVDGMHVSIGISLHGQGRRQGRRQAAPRQRHDDDDNGDDD